MGTLNAESRCSLNQNTINSTLLPDINPYGGIPQNLLINTIGFSILTLIFLILRKRGYKLLNEVVKADDVHQLSHWMSPLSSHILQSLSTRDGRDEGILCLKVRMGCVYKMTEGLRLLCNIFYNIPQI